MTNDWAWAAGLFEGEGCIRIQGTRGYNVTLLMSLTDPDVLQRFADVVGTGRITQRSQSGQKDHWKQAYFWSASGKDARRILTEFLPMLGLRRFAKAVSAISAVNTTYAERTCAECGTSFEPKTFGARSTVCGPECRRDMNNRRRRNQRASRRQEAA